MSVIQIGILLLPHGLTSITKPGIGTAPCKLVQNRTYETQNFDTFICVQKTDDLVPTKKSSSESGFYVLHYIRVREFDGLKLITLPT